VITANRFEKAALSTRYFLYGTRMYKALEAMEFASKYHTKFRKDGTTPEFHHQISIVQYLRTFIDQLVLPEETFAVGFLHDVVEDYDISLEEIDKRFGSIIAKAVEVISKPDPYSNEKYYRKIGENLIASIVKGADRINNVQTMTGVFNKEKQLAYLKEAQDYVLPMLKTARRKFPRQEPAYENAKFVLNSQIELIQEMHKEVI
jgi:(p)ppGpp synthase/HD superfamily hydrolase